MINQVQTGLQTNSGSMGRWEIHAHQGRNIDSTTARRVGILSSPGTPATIGDGDNLAACPRNNVLSGYRQ